MRMGGRGSSSGIGQAHGAGLKQQPDLDHSPSLQAALIKEENRTRDFKNEQMTVWDKNGEQVIHRRGKSGSVSYSTSEAQMYFYGATITHNHPHGDDRGGLSTTLSIPDVEPFRFGLKEMRASGAEGTYVLRNKNWNNKADKGYEFYQAYKQFGDQQDFGSLKNIKAAQEKALKSKIGKQYELTMKKASKLYENGKKDEAFKIYAEAKKLESGYKKEIKKALYENVNSTLNGWLKKNAPKYGFVYILTK